MSKPKKELKRPRKANGYRFPDRLPVGEVLKDSAKKEWIIGPPIGKGGFGEIYSAAENNATSTKTYPYAVKIEPHENGPLFMEKNFYIKIAKPEDVETWKKSNNIKILGIPTYYGSGTHTHNEQKYRFMVIERFGQDLSTLFQKTKKFPPPSVYKCALQIIDVLNYIHDKDYTHGDIKGGNLLLGLKKGTGNNIFLVDFGLACKYTTKEFKRDPRKAHNGTLEYTSCDSHEGVPTRRGDLEILGYNLLQWLNSSLPWENVKNKEKVHEMKKEFMSNVSKYMVQHFTNVPKVLCTFMEYISKLKYDESPDYTFCKNLFIKELGKLKVPIGGELIFTNNKTTNNIVMNDMNGISSEEDVTPVKRTRKQTVHSSPDIFQSTPSPRRTPKRAVKNVKKPDTNKKTSWRDAPTIKASNLDNKAGVYRKKRAN
ncbi:hypothetical protein O3M35_007422 [Rhynocoris fuscipes]|uniref:non-specific serine/threonine protein kinase n=1 Tax=Rhynocoris fuscipes TaxID=488301 RepID=A0AAW1DAY6_9HEMI